MLWYKAWLETRPRYIISLVGIVFLCSYLVYSKERPGGAPMPGGDYTFVLLEAHMALATLWVLAVTLLMMGGLVREHAAGSSSFTLALPASRQRLMAARIAVGLLQAITLAVIPWCSMSLVASIVGKTFSIPQILFHVLVLLAGGSFFFAIALLVSSTVEGEYTAPVVSFGVVFAILIELGNGKLQRFSPLVFMFGRFEYRDKHTHLLHGPIPWVEMAVWVSLAFLLMWTAIKVIQRRDF
jgi:ABC-type transport system involved in multi-copper enzyme maturation permease subunit